MDIAYYIPKKRLPSGTEIHISDTTLRDGAQMPGIFMSEAHKLRIFEFLHLIGIEKVECFAFSEADRASVSKMIEREYAHPQVTTWSRANREDINNVSDIAGIDEIGILMSVSDLHIFKKMRFATRHEAENSYLKALSHALDKRLRVRCHLEDITRADFAGFVAPLVRKIIQMAPDAIIRICDTVGIGIPDPNVDLPRGIPQLIKALKEIGVHNIETHMHDDFGNAVANSLIGFDYGANWTSATFLGIGERAGNAAIEEILINLQYVEGLENRYNLEFLTEFAKFMESELGIAIPGNKAVVGKNAFVHRSGIHAAAVIKDPATYEPFPPELVGGIRKLVAGPTSGLELIAFKINEILAEASSDIQVRKDDARVKAIFDEIQKTYLQGQRTASQSDVSWEELRALVEKHILSSS